MNGASAGYQDQCAGVERDQRTALLERIQNGDMQAITVFIKKYRDLVTAITDDVLKDKERSTRAAKASFHQAIQQIRSGVKPGQLEPWLMWLVRSEALSLTQCGNNARPAEPQPAAWEIEQAVLPFQAKAGQDGDEKNSGAPLQKEKLPACEGEAEESQTAQQTDGQVGSCDSVQSFEKTASENTADPEISPTAGLREEAAIKDAADASVAAALQQQSRNKKSYNIVTTIVLAVVILLLVWVALGLGMGKGLFRFSDLGYEWFNTHFFPLF